MVVTRLMANESIFTGLWGSSLRNDDGSCSLAFDRSLLTKKQPQPSDIGVWLFCPGELESSIRLGYSQARLSANELILQRVRKFDQVRLFAVLR
jgi:hypothetical protein